MDFLKKHYEKILLGLMLAGLIGVLVFMLFYIASDQEEMNNKGSQLTTPRAPALSNLDLAVLDGVVARAAVPYQLDLENTNRLFNPLEWQKSLDGSSLILANTRTGPQVAVVTNISPLYTVVSLASVVSNEVGVTYDIKVERQGAATPTKQRPVPHYVVKGDKPNVDFALLEVKGPPENPDGLVLKLSDTGETVTISKDKPFRHPDAYAADFRYDPEKRMFRHRREGDKVSFGGADYSVVEVNPTEVILQDQSNQKKTTLPFAP
jgi:hypothetical protein